MTTGFHRDWNLWSALNFMFFGRKVWYLVDSRHVVPRHANLILGDCSRIVTDIEAGAYGYRTIQTENESIYVPDGYYHHVTTESFALNYTMWWTSRDRLHRRKSLVDPWWFEALSRHFLLKPEYAADVQAAYQRCSAFGKAFGRYAYGLYLRVCDRFNDRRAVRRSVS